MKRIYCFLMIVFTVSLSACSAAPVQEPTALPTRVGIQDTATAVPPTAIPTSTATLVAPTPVAPTPEPDPHFPPEVIEYARSLVDNRKVPGIAIGLLTPDGEFFFNYGASTYENEPDSHRLIDENTLFEIGSITKVFTAILLANAVEEGLTTLDASSQDLAPEGVTMPAYVHQTITLRDIVTQRSGLPRMPSNFNPDDSTNPYADYTAELMYEYLDGLKTGSKGGDVYEYSNLGFMLLGDLLERAYGKPYAELLDEIITGPLDMPDTVITLTDDQQARFAKAHTDVYPTSSWEFALPGVGSIRSTTTDMLKFLAANLQPGDDQLGAAMKMIREECYDTGTSFVKVCLGIHTYDRYSKMIYQHDGQTGGYHSFSGFVPEDGTAVIILVNSNYNIDPLGLRLLDPKVPLPPID